MKKIILIMLTAMMGSSAFAQENNVQPGLFNELAQDFAAASNPLQLSDLPNWASRQNLGCTTVSSDDTYWSTTGGLFIMTVRVPSGGPLVPEKYFYKPTGMISNYPDNQPDLLAILFNAVTFSIDKEKMTVIDRENKERPTTSEFKKGSYIFMKITTADNKTDYGYCYPVK